MRTPLHKKLNEPHNHTNDANSDECSAKQYYTGNRAKPVRLCQVHQNKKSYSHDQNESESPIQIYKGVNFCLINTPKAFDEV